MHFHNIIGHLVNDVYAEIMNGGRHARRPFDVHFCLVLVRAGSWSLLALRHDSDCGPLVHIIIFAILTLF